MCARRSGIWTVGDQGPHDRHPAFGHGLMKKLEVDPSAHESAGGAQDGIFVVVVQRVRLDPVVADPGSSRGVFEGMPVLCIAPASLTAADILGSGERWRKSASW